MDRIDIHVDVPAVKFEELRGKNVPACDTSEEIRDRVIRARDIQLKRFGGDGVFSNSAMSPKQIRTFCPLDSECEALLENAMNRQGLSARAHDRILKVSRTIADLEGSDRIRARTSAKRSAIDRWIEITGFDLNLPDNAEAFPK
jgi:magnesium chelatase family protein